MPTLRETHLERSKANSAKVVLGRPIHEDQGVCVILSGAFSKARLSDGHFAA